VRLLFKPKMKEIYIPRDLEKEIKKDLKAKEIIAIVGARRCGKTTIMKRIFNELEKARFISFDDREILSLFNTDVKEFIKKYVEGIDYLFIDEFQYAKEGGRQLKYIYDIYEKVKIIISGSSAPELSVQSLKYLVGRIFIHTLYPLSFEEFIRYKDEGLYKLFKQKKQSEISVEMINKLYGEFIIYGGYPEVVLTKEKEQKEKIIANIYNTYLLKEIRDILHIAEDERLSKLIKTFALQVTGLINYNELSKITGFTYQELIKYVRILEKTFICLPSRPYFTNKMKELSKNPKIYFLDNGFRNSAIGNFQEVENRTDRGGLNENFVASELVKKNIKLDYWRTKAGAEVDFVVEKNSKLIPIEVKSKLSTPTHGKAFKNFVEAYGVEKGFILSQDYYDELKIGGARVEFKPLFSVGNLV